MKSKWPDIRKNLALITNWASTGALEKDIAKKLGISVSTLEEYKKKYPEFSEALNPARAMADIEVENTLYQTCIGYTRKEVQAFKCKEVYWDAQGRRCEKERLETVMVDKYYPPVPLSIMYFLNNRLPKKYRRNANKEMLDERKFEHEKEVDKGKDW